MDQNAATIARRRAVARLATIDVEIEAARRAVDAAADSTPGGSSRTKQFAVRSGAALHRTAVAFEKLRGLEQERDTLAARVARLEGLPEREPASAEVLRGATHIRAYDGVLSGWTRVVKVNRVSVSIGHGFKIPMSRVVDWR